MYHLTMRSTRNSHSSIVIFFIAIIIVIVVHRRRISSPPVFKTPEFLLDSLSCMKTQFEPKTDRDIWEDFSKVVMNCTVIDQLRTVMYQNRDDTKFFALPARYAQNPFINDCQVVVLDNGMDVSSEVALQQNFPLCTIVRAGPLEDNNGIGTHIQQMVGGTNGTIQVDIPDGSGSYHKTNISAIDIATFFSKNVKRGVVDVLWIDTEYSEYDILPFLLKSGQLHQLGYSICQINVEIHSHLNKDEYIGKYAKFVREMMSESRFLPLHSLQSVNLRTFLVNFGDPDCFDRFFETFEVPGSEFDE